MMSYSAPFLTLQLIFLFYNTNGVTTSDPNHFPPSQITTSTTPLQSTTKTNDKSHSPMILPQESDSKEAESEATSVTGDNQSESEPQHTPNSVYRRTTEATAEGPRVMTVFDEGDALLPGLSFEEQIIAIEGYIGGTKCGSRGFPWPRSSALGYNQIQSCYCDEICVIQHNCCPDLLILNITSHDEGQGSECVQTIPTGANMSDIKSDDFMTMITKCPTVKQISGAQTGSQNVPQDIVSKCENYHPNIPILSLPVSPKSTTITYRNIFCAQCNNVNITDTTSLHKWDAQLDCLGGMEELLRGNPDTAEIFKRLNSKQDVIRTGCKLKYVTQEHSPYGKRCRPTKTPLIDRCNQTGKWKFYSDKIDKACELYTSVVFYKYKNIFCFLCNIETQLNQMLLKQMVKSDTGDSIHSARIGFEALLDFSNAYVREEMNLEFGAARCQGHQIYNNITCECQDLKCSEGKDLSPEDPSTCTSTINSNSLGYSICFQIDLIFKQAVSDIKSLVKHISSRLSSCCFEAFSVRVTIQTWCPGYKNVTVSAEVMDYYQRGANTMNSYDVSATEIVFITIQEALSWLPDGLASHAISLKSNCPKDIETSRPCVDDRNLTVNGRQSTSPVIDGLGNVLQTVHFIPFRMTNLCPHVELPANDFEIINGLVYHTATNLKIEPDLVDLVDNKTVRLCRGAFLNVLSFVDASTCEDHIFRSDQIDYDEWTVEGLVSIVCTSLSLFCLFLTFVTYLIFKSLRDASGKNIMMLTVLLFLAQAFFEFALEQFENEAACKFFGISIHYFWLAAVFSMNACTIERFYKLCFPLRSRAFFYSDKPFVTASVYSLISPLIIVGVNILINQQLTGHVGYGNSQICYIAEIYSRIFAFAVPLAILLLTNIILFAITIHSIRRQTVLGQKSASSKVGIKACVQLSFVTGLTWLLVFLYEFISVSELGYVFTALIGLQGVMFFYSIVLNKRVIALYKGLWISKSQGSSSDRIISRSSDSNGKDEGGVFFDKKQNPVYKVSFLYKNKDTHTEVTHLSTEDSGVEK